jgi:hypothetical protein
MRKHMIGNIARILQLFVLVAAFCFAMPEGKQLRFIAQASCDEACVAASNGPGCLMEAGPTCTNCDLWEYYDCCGILIAAGCDDDWCGMYCA